MFFTLTLDLTDFSTFSLLMNFYIFFLALLRWQKKVNYVLALQLTLCEIEIYAL